MKQTTNDQTTLQMALVGYEIQRSRIEAAIAEIQAQLGSRGSARSTSPTTATAERTSRKKFSAAARKRMAAAQKKRWAGLKSKKAGAKKIKPKGFETDQNGQWFSASKGEGDEEDRSKTSSCQIQV